MIWKLRKFQKGHLLLEFWNEFNVKANIKPQCLCAFQIIFCFLVPAGRYYGRKNCL
jgi:hypothetical protein